jgi:signal peptidase I
MTAAVIAALVAIGVAALILTALMTTALTLRRRYVVVTVAGLSMAPTFRPGDRLVVRRTGPGRIRCGDVVVLTPDPDPAPGADRGGLWLVKRAAAVPGDPVPRGAVPALADTAEPVVPPGKLVLLGDNTEHSTDSRQHGYFDARRLVGRVVRPAPAGRR